MQHLAEMPVSAPKSSKTNHISTSNSCHSENFLCLLSRVSECRELCPTPAAESPDAYEIFSLPHPRSASSTNTAAVLSTHLVHYDGDRLCNK